MSVGALPRQLRTLQAMFEVIDTVEKIVGASMAPTLHKGVEWRVTTPRVLVTVYVSPVGDIILTIGTPLTVNGHRMGDGHQFSGSERVWSNGFFPSHYRRVLDLIRAEFP